MPTSEHLVRFLSTTVETTERLDVLLLLRGSVPRRLTAAAVARALRVPESLAEQDLALLCGRGFLAVTLGSDLNYAYQPVSAELDALVAELAKAVEKSRAEVRAHLRRPAVDPVRAFAEAFRIRRKDDEDG